MWLKKITCLSLDLFVFLEMEINKRIEIVLLMAKYESVMTVKMILQAKDIPHENIIRNKFTNTGTDLDTPKSGTFSIRTEEKEDILVIFKDG